MAIRSTDTRDAIPQRVIIGPQQPDVSQIPREELAFHRSRRTNIVLRFTLVRVKKSVINPLITRWLNVHHGPRWGNSWERKKAV